MIERASLGVPVLGTWAGGTQYVVNLLRAVASLGARRPRLSLLVGPSTARHLPEHASVLPLVDDLVALGGVALEGVARPVRAFATLQAACAGHLDLVFPLNSEARPELPAASWIPDFQHRHMPALFSEEENADRDRRFGQIARDARLVVLSSQDALADFRRFHPEARGVARVLSFCSAPAADWFAQGPAAAQLARGLPATFLMVANQFWVHKDHRTAFRALALLRARGVDLHLVCTGRTSDYRDPSYFETLKRDLAAAGLADRVHILGSIDRAEQIALMRRAAALVQPSHFEGWSTVVEDARALGKTIFLSDLAVHREQAPAHAVFFAKGDPEALAARIAAHAGALAPGPDPAREAAALADGAARVERYGRAVAELALESAYVFDRPPRGLGPRLARLLAHPFAEAT